MAVPLRSTAPAIIAWLGEAPSPALMESLGALGHLRSGWSPDAQIIAVSASAGTEALRDLPRGPQHPPIIAASHHEPSQGERLEWIQAGADDLVSFYALPHAVSRRLRGVQRVRRKADSGDPTSLVEPLDLAERPSQQPVSVPPTDAFPPLRVPVGEAGIPAALTLYVDGLQRYLSARDAWVARWGEEGLTRMLELFQVREQVPPKIDGQPHIIAFGQTFGSAEQALHWPVLLRRGPSRRRQGIDTIQAQVLGAGTDGMVLELDFNASPRQKLVADLPVDQNTNAQLLVEARWQRRVSPSRWQLGVIALEMRLRQIIG